MKRAHFTYMSNIKSVNAKVKVTWSLLLGGVFFLVFFFSEFCHTLK